MSEQEQKVLASFIKGVHHALRCKSKQIGVERAWAEHCSQHSLLQQYAEKMQRLATQFWDQESEGAGKSRMDWVAEKSLQYFMQGGVAKERDKEKRQEKQLEARCGCDSMTCEFSEASVEQLPCSVTNCLYLLDVGSCYNPFKDFPCFKVLPIDLAPALPEVLRCNFLDLNITSCKTSNFDWGAINLCSSISQLPGNFFHVVVFSLFLEYLPSPEHRYTCCEKAYSLLREEGLLFIVTPDIRQASRGSVLMKNWRIALAHIGFSRVYYEKLAHIQCMAYRKSTNPSVPILWATRQKVSGEDAKLIHIPQDFQDYSIAVDNSELTLYNVCRDEGNIVTLFSELPDTF
ncbi:hypothetical protein PR048_019664 [Dryococelus australis]|uniref:S-adenosylmethionine sensor upstream of mTORC1 n=1 Tax=Dryococelus australis TaxID=614101 RepID=A0ABQ9H442_9NEOP|nr:hypothetical protein PR048_019664 [Dryococelus australis]